MHSDSSIKHKKWLLAVPVAAGYPHPIHTFNHVGIHACIRAHISSHVSSKSYNINYIKIWTNMFFFSQNYHKLFCIIFIITYFFL